MITILLLAAALLLAGFAYTVFKVKRDNGRIMPDGDFVRVGGIQLHYHHYPIRDGDEKTPVLVFLHGASGNSYDSRLAFLETLRGRHPLLFVDRPGLGFSEGQAGVHDLPAGQARALAQLLEHLEIEAAVVVGHSLGGAVTAALGLVAPERVKGLALLAPVSHAWPGGVNWYYSVAAWPVVGSLFCWTLTLPVGNWLAPRAMTNVFYPDRPPPAYPEETRLPLLFRPKTFRANARQIACLKPAIIEQSKRYSQLSQPTLIVTGTEDTVVWPSIHCEGLLRDLPNAKLLFLDKAGHMPHHTHSDVIARALDALVRQVEDETKVNVTGTSSARRSMERL